MNIRYIQSNLSKMADENVLRFIFDLVLQNIQDINSYESGKEYNKGDRVYLQENGKHQIFQCKIDHSSNSFVAEEWENILEVYNGSFERIYNLNIQEEVHIIDENTVNGITTNLEFQSGMTSFALYCGKKRYSSKYDFTVNKNNIKFKKPFNVGDRVILEVREIIGISVIIYSITGKPYNVIIDDDGVVSLMEITKFDDSSYEFATVITGEQRYTLAVDDLTVDPPELKLIEDVETLIIGTDNKVYHISVRDNKILMIDKSGDVADKQHITKFIRGNDNKIYTLHPDENGEVIVTAVDETLVTGDAKKGIIVFDEKLNLRLITIAYGKIIIRDYEDEVFRHAINFIDISTKNPMRLVITEDYEISLLEGYDENELIKADPVEYYYFYDDEWVYHRMYVEDGVLKVEEAVQDDGIDFEGIFLRKPNQELLHLTFPLTINDEVYIEDMDEGVNVFTSINFKDSSTGELVRLVANDESEIDLYKGDLLDDPTGSVVNENFYFFGQDQKYMKLFIEDGELFFEFCNEELGRIDKGVNIIDPNGNIIKIRYDGEKLYLNKVIDKLTKQGTFANPIDGFVVNIDGQNKLVTVNNESTGFIMQDTDHKFVTNDHYIVSQDDRLYKLNINNDQITFDECNKDGYYLENVTKGTFIKSFEMINKVDINENIIFRPISTFVHRVQCVNGKAYILDVLGEPGEEIIVFREIEDSEFTQSVGAGELYLQNNEGMYYKLNIDENLNMNFEITEMINTVNYEVSSILETTQGWYRLSIDNKSIRVIKIFDNIYKNGMSYGNIVVKDFVVMSSGGTEFSLSANSLADLHITEKNPYENKGLVLLSNDGYNYGVGVSNGSLVAYRTYIMNNEVPEELQLHDIASNNNYKIRMNGCKLIIEPMIDEVAIDRSLIAIDVYNNEYTVEIENGELKTTLL